MNKFEYIEYIKNSGIEIHNNIIKEGPENIKRRKEEMKNLVLQRAKEVLDGYILGNGGVYDDKIIQSSWNKVKDYMECKAKVEEARSMSNYEFIKSLTPEELAIFLAIDSGKRSCDPEDWIGQIGPTLKWLNEKTEFEIGEFNDSLEFLNSNYNFSYEGIKPGDIKECVDEKKAE